MSDFVLFQITNKPNIYIGNIETFKNILNINIYVGKN